MRYTQNLRVEGDKVFSYNTHVATINHTNRTLTKLGWWSITTSKHINHVADKYGLTVVELSEKEKKARAKKAAKEEEKEAASMLKMVGNIAALASIFTDNKKDANDWKARMLKAGLSNKGLIMPDDWNELSEDEKEKRLNKVIELSQEA